LTDSTTTNYGWSYPTNGADDSTWGNTLNNTIIAIDAQMKTTDTKATAGTTALQAASNLSDVANPGTARTNLGLGTAAVAAATNSSAPLAAAFGPFVAGNLSLFINTSGSIEDSGISGTDVLTKSSNLSGISTPSTARSNLGLGSIATHNVTISSSAPSGGSDGDIWLQYS